jgi:protein TonB
VRGWSWLPPALSIAGHGIVLMLLILFAGQVTPLLLPVAEKKLAIAVLLTPPPAPEPPPAAEPPPPELEPPPVVEAAPPPEPPPPPPAQPPPKLAVKPPPPQRPPPPRPVRAPPPPTPPPPMQTAALPPPAPPPAAPVVSQGYRFALSAWLERHKRYPEGARSRGEEGHAVLRFRVERSGRLVNYAIVRGTGYADLDAALDQMMRGASLPPFPADMTASDVEFSVTVRFALAR